MMPYYDETKAQELIGKIVLVGVTYVDASGNTYARKQWVGTITEVGANKGIVIVLRDGEPCVLPPDLNILHPAEPGVYRLHSTGEVVTDPDYTTTWIREKQPADASGKLPTADQRKSWWRRFIGG